MKVAEEVLQEAKDFKEELESKVVIVKMKAGEGGKVFGSVSSKEIVSAFKDQENIELDKKKIHMKDAIKSFGTYEVDIKLHAKVTGTLHVKVVEA